MKMKIRLQLRLRVVIHKERRISIGAFVVLVEYRKYSKAYREGTFSRLFVLVLSSCLVPGETFIVETDVSCMVING